MVLRRDVLTTWRRRSGLWLILVSLFLSDFAIYGSMGFGAGIYLYKRLAEQIIFIRLNDIMNNNYAYLI